MTNDVDKRLKARQRQLDQQQNKEESGRNLQTDRREVAKRKYSSSFFDRVADSDLESEAQHKIEDKLPATFSNAHITGVRRRVYERQQALLNRAKAERFVVENKPGSVLKRNPGLHAVIRGEEVDVTNPPQSGRVSVDAVPQELDSEQRRVARGAIREVATTQQSLSVSGTGLRQFTTATSETHTVKHDSDDDGLFGSTIGKVFG